MMKEILQKSFVRIWKKVSQNLLIRRSFLNIIGLLSKFGAVSLALLALCDAAFSVGSATGYILNYGLEGGLIGLITFIPMARVATALEDASLEHFGEANEIQKEIAAIRAQARADKKARMAQTLKKTVQAGQATTGKAPQKPTAPGARAAPQTKPGQPVKHPVAAKAGQPNKSATSKNTATLPKATAPKATAPISSVENNPLVQTGEKPLVHPTPSAQVIQLQKESNKPQNVSKEEISAQPLSENTPRSIQA